MFKKITLIFLTLLLSGCVTDKDLLCNYPINMSLGNLIIVNRQCIEFGNKVTAFIEVQDRITGIHYMYSAHVEHGKVSFDVSNDSILNVERTDD